ncbi:MAG: hypothetical protein IJV59_03945 [Eubacterium sp.]|nr:hypothetical protein [Eubacterium sp.]
MRKIDTATWDRTAHFNSYVDAQFPYIIVGKDIDVTNIYRFAREKGVSFTYCMIYAATKIANEIPNFQYRMLNGEPYDIEHTVATNTHLKKGAETFSMVRCDDYDTMEEYARKNREKADLPADDVDPREAEFANDIISFSSIPWIRYTHFIRTVKTLGKDTNPKITFGKYEWEGDRLMMPFTLQVHHGLMDGLHTGRYFNRLEEYLAAGVF